MNHPGGLNYQLNYSEQTDDLSVTTPNTIKKKPDGFSPIANVYIVLEPGRDMEHTSSSSHHCIELLIMIIDGRNKKRLLFLYLESNYWITI